MADPALYVPGPRSPSPDGRQSETALTIRRGVTRLLCDLGYACLPEMPLANGRRADVVALGSDAEFWIIEIKSSAADLATDHKWSDYRDFCDRLSFATLPDLTGLPFPEDCGLIAADGHYAEQLREAPEHKLVAARRKAMLIRFATAAAGRLQALDDPMVERGWSVG